MRLLPASARVSDLMTRGVFTLSPGHSLPLAETMMRLRHIRHIPVVDDAHRVVGLVTHRDLLAAQISALSPLSEEERSSLQLMVPVSKIMQTEVWTVAPDAPATHAAQLLRDHRFGCLPVTENGRLVGIVTESDLLRLIVEPGVPPPASWPVRHFMTGAPVAITLDTTLAEARLEIERHHIHHLPVVSEGRPLGIVHERDLSIAEAIFGASQETRAVHVAQLLGNIQSAQVHPDDRLGPVLVRMLNERVDAVLVVDAGVLAGIFTLFDGARVLTEMIDLTLPVAPAARPG